jgi:hypothetical protein
VAAFGRQDEDWDTLVGAGKDFLRERAELARDTSYTEMNATLARRTALRQFDYSQQIDRAGMGHLLGRIVEETFPSVGAMLSSLVIYLDANDAGSGFYVLAEQMGLLPSGASKAAKERFWVEQVTLVFQHFQGPAPKS